MNDGFDPADFIAGFIAETEEHLASANANLLAVEAAAAHNQPTPRQIRELFRSFHTVKGLAAMVGVEPIVDLAHAMESVLRDADVAAARLLPEAVELLLKAVRAIETRVQALGKGHAVPPASTKLLDALNGLRQETTPVIPREGATTLAPELWTKLAAADRVQLTQGLGAGRRAFVLRFVPSVEQAAAGITITSIREKAATVAEVVKVVPQSVSASAGAPPGLAFALLLLADTEGAALAQALGVAGEALTPVLALAPAAEDSVADQEMSSDEQQRRGVVRVDVARLDDALERLSALVVTQFRLARTLAAMRAAGADVRELSHVVAENGRQLRDLRASIMRARMVSVAELLERIPLLVRGLSRATGKDVRLVMATGNAELDKGVAERIFPAVVHLVRNAVDHAIEAPAERRAAGKPEAGLLTVACHERSDNRLELTVTDDGRGVDAAAVAARAGAPVPESDAALLDLLARPGLSTKATVTTTSGRGVGMDVVRRIAVEELRGELSMRTTRGQGTTFALRIPLSITIVDAFSFLCGGQTFVVPVAMIEEVQELEPGRTIRGPDRRRTPRGDPDRRRVPRATEMMQRRGEAVPVVRLHDLLGLDAIEVARPKAIVVRREGAPLAFAVDRMLGQQEIVVRPLEDRLVKVQGVSGTTDLGDGRPTLVLDLLAIGEQLLAASTEASA
ncbi:MAG TPA: chemotaxis protein CheW [Polyangia bacterium]|nr:chemotaxis protein CheW [Polyangia bacterium]